MYGWISREMMMGSSSCRFLRACAGVIVLVGVLGLLMVKGNIDSRENGGRRISKAGIVIYKGVVPGIMKQDFVEAVNMGRRKHRVLSIFELNYTSKRRIPNGPDPIHNRRAGNSHRPPGQA